MLTRKEIEDIESKVLAPYAMKAKDSRGRVYKEEEHPYRTCYQRDRDRIIHSTAFRRLEYKTQVFVNHEGDYYRTRLTHTLEVAQIAVSIARNLGLNPDLTEAIAIAHDIGHPPFGHSGEQELHGLMKDHGGFDHNIQGLRVVDILEERYPDFKGLNLSWEVREGINKHSTPYDESSSLSQLEPEKSPTLEAQIVDLADEIAYDNHDLDDGLTSGLIKEEDLCGISLWKKMRDNITKAHPDMNDQIRKYQMVRSLINMEVTDLINESENRIGAFEINSAESARSRPERTAAFSKGLVDERKPLKKFLYDNLYMHRKVVGMADKSRRFIRELFNSYISNPEQLPPTSSQRLKSGGPEAAGAADKYRVVCDYIAGMTDRYALNEYIRLFNPYERM
ncbi:MAG: deoxyguanosinetriphosphate triphosphohydrolase [Omnitrophica WOR_2 bacterium RIFCSPLOWO2_12_FULL_51_24]|nr:MAG: deoxyguanosinetriphosphate triphosphohydrolase [Omnitrophica WOR_2 bacterium RIFCSPHIGHO2_01_FULL_49_10]OGX32512.1 MAG: deoxyguanosinetriphosphate triphosphohydrolase [Omnitrophica WOR_2 bacterium RIFCSPLOWO2_02_FULL_50_19]OGX43291.1 MAG: deoxyguanosinetriphosphate triphosphohydrolase [Omnitrophica WOR_2 bacterium RIFCSPLOWO2_12_FULL_51_24]